MKTCRVNTSASLVALLAFAAMTIPTSKIEAQENSTVTVAGFSVNRSIFGMDQPMAMGRGEGVEVTLCVQLEGQHVIAVAEEQKKLPAISTDAGKKLAEDEGWSDFGTQISDDGHAVWFPVKSPDVPPSGTTSLKVSGEITLIVGSEPTKSDHEIVLTQGTKGKLGKADVVIEDVSKNEFGDGGIVVGFSSKSNEFGLISEFKFVDADGNEIESSEMGSTRFGFGDDMTTTKSFTLAGEPKQVKVRVSYFAKTSEVNVPVDAEVTLGLGD